MGLVANSKPNDVRLIDRLLVMIDSASVVPNREFHPNGLVGSAGGDSGRTVGPLRSRPGRTSGCRVTASVRLTRLPAFRDTRRMSSFGQQAESAVDRLAIGKHVGEVRINQHQVGPSRRPAIVFASNAALQLRKIIFLSHVVTALSCRFLLHTAFALSASQGAH